MFAKTKASFSDLSAKAADFCRGRKAEVVTVAGGGLVAANEAVFAAAPDYTTLTSGIDFASAGTAVLAVFAALAGVYVVALGGKIVLRNLKGG